MNFDWNNFIFIIKRNTINEIYVDDYYMDIEKLQGTPIWDRYHNFMYWLDNYPSDILEVTNKKLIDYSLYETIRNYINDNRVNKHRIKLEV